MRFLTPNIRIQIRMPININIQMRSSRILFHLHMHTLSPKDSRQGLWHLSKDSHNGKLLLMLRFRLAGLVLGWQKDVKESDSGPPRAPCV